MNRSVIISLAFYLFFIIMIFVLDASQPSSRFGPSIGIFAIWAWCLYTLLMWIKNSVMVFLDKMQNRRINLLIHSFSGAFLIGASYYFGGLTVFLDNIT